MGKKKRGTLPMMASSSKPLVFKTFRIAINCWSEVKPEVICRVRMLTLFTGKSAGLSQNWATSLEIDEDDGAARFGRAQEPAFAAVGIVGVPVCEQGASRRAGRTDETPGELARERDGFSRKLRQRRQRNRLGLFCLHRLGRRVRACEIQRDFGDSIIDRSGMKPKIQRHFEVFSPCDFIDVSAFKPRWIPSKKWRELIKKVWEVDPLLCPNATRR